MKIAITGAAGFIGTELRERLEGEADVLGLVREGESDILTVTDYSVKELAELFSGVDCVIHLASKRGAGQNYEEYHENDTLLENVLNAMVCAKVPKIIFMSSLAVYSDQSELPWKETQLPLPQTFYGLSKLAGENLCRYYSKKGIKYIIFRCGIVYGGRDLTRMTGSFIRMAADRQTLVVRGKSVARRDFIYVKEVVNALSWGAMECADENCIINLGSGGRYTNLEFAEAVNRAFHNEGNIEYASELDENLSDSYLDSDKLISEGYVRRYTLDSSMEDIAAQLSQKTAHTKEGAQ